jgi:FdhD protein
MARPGVAPAHPIRWPIDDGADDLVAVEAPLEIRMGARSIAVTMRTPGDDFDLAVGYLFAEGIVDGPDDVLEVRRCRDADAVRVVPAAHVTIPEARVTPISSACGVCGVASLDHVPAPHGTPRWSTGPLDPEVLGSLPAVITAAQVNFRHTGGIHAAARCSPRGEVLDVREDVGRHNALDKLVGRALSTGALPLADQVVVLSGRASWELLQKAVRAGAAVVAAVGAPSTAALDVAEAHGVTLIGFLRADRFNVYSHADRVAVDGPT